MKRFGIIIILLLILPMVSAIEVDVKDSYKQGETLIVKISGNFIEPILEENILFYKRHIRVPMEAHLTKINEDYYIYALLGERMPDNYSIEISDAKYMQGAATSEEDIIRNFSITGETAEFSVNPGFVATEEDFSIELQNLQDHSIDVTISTTTTFGDSLGFFASLFGGGDSEGEDVPSITLKSGEKRTISFDTDEITANTLKNLKLSSGEFSYDVPIYIYGIKDAKKDEDYKFDPAQLNVSMSTGSNRTQTIYLYNFGEEDIENISLSVSSSLKPYVDFTTEEVDRLDANSSLKLELYISSSIEEQDIEGQLSAKSELGTYAYSALFLKFIPDYIPSEDEQEVTDPLAKLKQEEEQEEGSGTGKLVGWMIILLVLILILWFFKAKYSKARR